MANARIDFCDPNQPKDQDSSAQERLRPDRPRGFLLGEHGVDKIEPDAGDDLGRSEP
jgi:hypothetical protein